MQIGAKIRSDNGTKTFAKSKTPQITSQPLTNCMKNPVSIKAVANFIIFSGGGEGIGIKLKKPFNPKTKNSSPKIILAPISTFDFM